MGGHSISKVLAGLSAARLVSSTTPTFSITAAFWLGCPGLSLLTDPEAMIVPGSGRDQTQVIASRTIGRTSSAGRRNLS
jgi:hypothetical protein